MKGAFVILIATIIIGIVLYIFELRYRKNHPGLPIADEKNGRRAEDKGNDVPNSNSISGEKEPEVCCGLHLVCEKDSLSPMSTDIIYYDDEELDRFIGRNSDDYTPEETEEFREVLMTLRKEDILGWARSITQRRLELPGEIRDELLMLANEVRESVK